jgi:hypothetical protein
MMLNKWIHAVPKIALAGAILMITGCPSPPITGPQSLPSDAQDACPLPSATFNGWFQSGTPSLDGVVNPANSVTFPNVPNCSFYAWAEQMFLWLNSPAPATYGGGGGRIFDSAAFFDVSPLQSDGSRTFVPHTVGLIRPISLRAAQVGPHGLQLVIDRAGRPLEVAPLKKGAKPMVRNAAGQLVEIAHARLNQDGTPVLLDKAGKVIEPQISSGTSTAGRNDASNALTISKFVIDGVAIFLDFNSALVQVEQGQSDSGVLEAQTGSLVYYIAMVNDVYAYFATGQKDGAIAASKFPTSQTDLNSITTFASGHGVTFPDPNALTVEVKSSWVETTGLANLNTYITRTAIIPTYDTTNPNQWVPNGQKTTQLALVGMHVVGSAAGHPEMIWATFEHFANAPRATYSYTNTSNATTTVTQNTGANWVSSANGSSGPFNNIHMSLSGANIVPFSPFSISPSDTLRSMPWGVAGSNATSNTQVISMNNHVLEMLTSGDVRGNYVMTGATWTIGGAIPPSATQVGTNVMANTTMETYEQSLNCFDCHQGNALGDSGGSGLSHIYGPLKKLF